MNTEPMKWKKSAIRSLVRNVNTDAGSNVPDDYAGFDALLGIYIDEYGQDDVMDAFMTICRKPVSNNIIHETKTSREVIRHVQDALVGLIGERASNLYVIAQAPEANVIDVPNHSYSGDTTPMMELDLFTDAKCRGLDSSLFFPETTGQSRVVAKFCGDCAVKSLCLEYALEHDEQGVWGGTTEKERLRMRRK